MTFTGSLWCTAVRNSPISILKPPSPVSAMTWRERSRRLDTVGLTKRGSHSAVVEGSQDPLRSALPNPVAGPECVQPGIDDEHGVAFGGIADGPRHRLRVDAVAAAVRVRLLVQHLIPLSAFTRYARKKTAIAFGCDFVEQKL